MNRLTQIEVDKLGGALHRLAELNQKTIKEATDAAEARGLEKFIQENAAAHLNELLACWITVQQEYRPLLQGFTALFHNAIALIDRHNNQSKEASTIVKP